MPLALIHVTAAFSNAVLVAIMPQVNGFAKKLDLPIPLPITSNQVLEFRVNPIQGMIGGGLWLTNHYLFRYENGCATSFRSPANFFYEESFPFPISKYTGRDNMTTNDAIELARDTLRKLGYTPELLYADKPPASFQGSFDTKDGHHVPYCEIRWSKNATSEEDRTNSANLEFQINMESKQVVGMSIVSPKIWQPSPVINVQPELESDYRKHFRNHTNAPVHLNTGAPPNILRKTE